MNVYRKFHEYMADRQLWDVVTYLFFGGLATVVNIVSFAIAFHMLNISWPISNTISWILSVLFAFATNKLWVFHTKTDSRRGLLWEFTKFMVARIFSYGLDMFTMWLIIDVMDGSDLGAKIITQILVVVVNYVFSKVFIFTSHKRE
ncbi:GtrA family protein [Lacticaseibacillus sp. 866-1]|uniref:GtrA family protein n=1 Tax=Lacticaseibacillus sp. 866-1 TaxID=2799576 RepID=UPI001942CEE0|nr:GtrA family protein [Lacticaseibacillus sp. 866-1]